MLFLLMKCEMYLKWFCYEKLWIERTSCSFWFGSKYYFKNGKHYIKDLNDVCFLFP